MARSQRDSDSDCDKILVIILLVFYLMAAVALNVISIVDFIPHDPEFTIASFTMTGLNVSASSSQQVSGNWDARFQIRNRNFELDYEDLETSIFYNDELLSRVVIPAFHQRARNLTLVEAQYSAVDRLVAVVGPATVTALTADLARGLVGFDVRVVGRERSYGEQLQVLCGVVPVTVTVSEDGASGKFDGGPRKCMVSAT